MNILIDTYKTKDLFSGLGQFSLSFARHLIARQPNEWKVDFLLPEHTDIEFIQNNAGIIRASFLRRYFPFLNKNYFIWHSLSQIPSFPPPKNAIWILTIHDLNFLIEKSASKKKKYLRRLQKNVSRADYITTISHFTKSEIEKNLEIGAKEIRVIYNGVNSGAGIEQIKPDFVSKEKFYFSIGIFNAKKNFKVLLPLMKHFTDRQLIIAGNKDTGYGKEMEDEIVKLGLQDRIILPGKISESHKQWLYAHCEAFLFPSLAEGFGLPVIEAMLAGKPVFLSKKTSLPEIGGPLAFYFDQFDPDYMAKTIESNLDQVNQNPEKFMTESIEYASRFSWENSISQYMNLYKEILAGQQ